MEKIRFEFDLGKAIEVVIYIAQKTPQPTFHSISKILYFADKTSLEMYGRFICGETYYAMKHGPVPTNIYDLLKEAATTTAYGFKVENERRIIPLREAQLEKLSPSDIQCLDQIITIYKDVPFWKRTQDSHDAAWLQAWDARGNKASQIISVESIIELFDDGEELLDHLHHQHD